jgi:hypothetical protein
MVEVLFVVYLLRAMSFSAPLLSDITIAYFNQWKKFFLPVTVSVYHLNFCHI